MCYVNKAADFVPVCGGKGRAEYHIKALNLPVNLRFGSRVRSQALGSQLNNKAADTSILWRCLFTGWFVSLYRIEWGATQLGRNSVLRHCSFTLKELIEFVRARSTDTSLLPLFRQCYVYNSLGGDTMVKNTLGAIFVCEVDRRGEALVFRLCAASLPG